MTDKVEKKNEGEQLVCSTKGCGNTKFRPSTMFYSHNQSDSPGNALMICTVCLAVFNAGPNLQIQKGENDANG